MFHFCFSTQFPLFEPSSERSKGFNNQIPMGPSLWNCPDKIESIQHRRGKDQGKTTKAHSLWWLIWKTEEWDLLLFFYSLILEGSIFNESFNYIFSRHILDLSPFMRRLIGLNNFLTKKNKKFFIEKFFEIKVKRNINI